MAGIGFGFIPTHSGEVLKDEIEYRGVSQRDLAGKMGLTPSVVNEILNGKRPVTTRTALLFEAALDVPAELLLRMQLKYDLQAASTDEVLQDRLMQVRKLAFA